jgi:hypothetical protein
LPLRGHDENRRAALRENTGDVLEKRGCAARARQGCLVTAHAPRFTAGKHYPR